MKLFFYQILSKFNSSVAVSLLFVFQAGTISTFKYELLLLAYLYIHVYTNINKEVIGHCFSVKGGWNILVILDTLL